MNPNKNLTYFLAILFFAATFAACKKDYYEDSGLQKGIYSESSLAFLQQRSFFFDSLVTVIQLAGMDPVLEDSSITFFAPTNHAIAKAMNQINKERNSNFKDSLRLQDIPQEIWRKFISHYTFREKYMLKDIARRDPSQLNVYSGMNLESWDGYIMNLGVVFSNYSSTKDVGPRKVTITDIGDLAKPNNVTSSIATSDLQTKNGIIHVLDDNHEFGFSVLKFAALVNQYIQ